jgi:DNA-binding IclR family transcriptional regulator
LRIQLAVGAQVPFHCTASGKMYLSSLRSDKLNRVLKWLELERRTDKTITDREQLKEELANTRQRDYATDDQEFMDGMTALAVPIKDGEGRLLSTLSIHAPEQRQEVESLVKQLSDLQRAAQRIEELCVS